ncbi:MAG: cation-translocating P-type ATPase [Spirochaetaceae bacterium]|nr:cation-translocating P-type ATPase [Spirochaetaceae bacterium]
MEYKQTDFSFAVGGMTCASCVRFVEKEVARIPGVEYVSVTLADGKAYAVTDGRPDWEELASAVSRAGYEPLESVPDDDEVEAEAKAAGRRVLISWAVAIPAMVLMVLHMSGLHLPWLPAAEAVAGLAVLFGPGRRILKGAWIALSHRHANMDVLVSLGTLAAWVTAVLAWSGLPIRSFGALAPMLPAFHLTGRLLEARLRRRAGADLRALMSSGDGTANILEDDGSILEIPVEAVKIGAVMRIRTGERIPLDGIVKKGSGSVGEAMITGEPIPAGKTPGDEVIGGTVLESGVLEVEVTRTGEDAFLARMLSLVEQAQGVQVPLQALADRVANVFVPVVFGIAMAALAAWVVFFPGLEPFLVKAAEILPWVPLGAGSWTTGIFAMVSLLVVACPCALGLATPMAVSVGSGLAARRGLLIKGGEALQTAGRLDILLFDKTGTLTVGRPRVVWSDVPEDDARAAAALEALSVHPLARAVADWAGQNASDGQLEVSDVEEIAGEGIKGIVGGVAFEVGRPGDAEIPDALGADFIGTLIEVRRDGKATGRIALADPIKDEAASSVAALMGRGVRPVMITGDAEASALSVAARVGIPASDVRSSLRPEDKLRIVQEFQKKGLRVGMTGDGINDAAALKAADVGFALAEGTDLSMEAGDVVITRGGLSRLVEALDLSALMVRKIKSNLAWAFVYNLLAIPAAGLALVHPLIAETAMTLSSVGVVLNSLAIRGTYERKIRRRRK